VALNALSQADRRFWPVQNGEPQAANDAVPK
jgi:hypothetical protein